MIKFWKNAARGKSRYQIRPPEPREIADNTNENNDPPESATATLRLDDWPEADPVGEDKLKLSRLSKTLEDVMNDPSCAGYFIQYLESISSSTPALFWIDVERFRSAASQLPSGVRRSASCLVKKRRQVIRTTSCDTNLLQSDDVDNNETHLVNSIASKKNSTEKKPIDNELRKKILDDAVRIFKKYIALEAVHKLNLTDNIRNAIVSSICHPEGLVDMDCFQIAQERVFSKLKEHYYESFLQSAFYCKYQIDILTSGSLSLEDVINNEMSLFYFMEFLEQERCSVLMEFFIAVVNFKETILGQDKLESKQIEKDAIVIYDKYFSMQAHCPLGFTSEMRLHVEEGICSENGTLPGCYDRPFRIAISALRAQLKSFLTSEMYFRYLSEMINATRAPLTSKHQKNASDCGSDKSIGSHNALLAMGDVHFRRERSPSQANMVMSSHQLYDPDSLWFRRQEGLSLGRVNSLGRFESRLDPDPDKKCQSWARKGWGTVVGKLMPNSEAQMDEEMAWQVANMIVKDVTDLTMATGDH